METGRHRCHQCPINTQSYLCSQPCGVSVPLAERSPRVAAVAAEMSAGRSRCVRPGIKHPETEVSGRGHRAPVYVTSQHVREFEVA